MDKEDSAMKKYIKKLHSGFSIAELLISMLVVMVVAAAMVPIIGPKKLKVPNINKSHGIFECYYEPDGRLMQYYANNRGHKEDAAHEVQGDHCTFTVPVADRYQIYAIGAGSDGYTAKEGMGYEVSPNSIAYSDYISISKWNSDLKNTGANAKELKGISNVSDAIRTAFNDWANTKRKQNPPSELYLAFNNLQSPVGNGGMALSVIRSYNETEACKFCPNGAGCVGPYQKDTIWRSATVNKGLGEAKNAGMCYLFEHGKGSNSGKGRIIDQGTILVPFDGNTLLTILNTDDVTSIKTNGGAEVTLHAAPAGKSAYISKVGQLCDGGVDDKLTELCPENASLRMSEEFMNNDKISGVKFVKDGVLGDPPDIGDLTTGSRQNYGSSKGLVTGTGGFKIADGQGSKKGAVNYTDKAFYWTYTALGIDYKYGAAGTPGDKFSMTYNNLHGTLYLYPGILAGGKALPTVISKVEYSSGADRATEEAKKAYVLSANSYDTPGSVTSVNIPLSGDIMPYPNKSGDIWKAVTPRNNEKFSDYIAKMNASGFRGGLYECDKQGSCPGYAGSGAYPLVYVGDGDNILKIEDKQPRFLPNHTNNGTFQRSYQVTDQMTEPKVCQDTNAAPIDIARNVPVPGRPGKTYNILYCIATNDQRRDGAVVIIW